MGHLRLSSILFACLAGFTLHAQTLELETVATGFTNLVDLAHCGDSRLFIVERSGVIILRADGQVLATPFLDISGPVNSSGGEQGMLGLAFHPQYTANGFFYVYYCSGTGNGAVRLSRFTVSADPNVANAASEVVLFELGQPYSNHNGGDIAFGPDGHLYFAPGDGGDGDDPGNRAQNMSLGFGKLHRIDVNGALPYSIPANNPFASANNVDTLRSIFASGLRNPFRFGFDVTTGDLWIGDVGQALKEEVDRIAVGNLSGPNFGWRCREGTIANAAVDQGTCPPASAYVEPIQDHNHSGGWCSLIGGRVYRGTRYPNLAGRYIYTDYCHGKFHSLRPNGSGGWIQEALTTTGSYGLACIAEDVNNELYAVNTETGVISRIIDAGASVKLNAKLVLEGPFDSGTGLMNDALRMASLVPATEPYTTTLGYPKVSKGGGEVTTAPVLAITGNNAVVDWVRVELRPAAQPTMIAATAQGLLQRDGDVVAADGISPLTFRVGSGSYLVVVRHRNHFACMTSSGVSLTNTSVILDMRSTATITYGTNGRKPIGSTQALWAGNTQADGAMRYVGASNDRDPILTRIGGSVPTATVNGYFPEDVNMDGAVRYVGGANDRDPILVNIGGSIPTAFILQQLP
ncbi:MAG: PQQ-dependent sugar dehydrogenase [Flavobacteriales bacterium]|nr:PQQ-dependent sugar dehydrogenase [Flavobacteriales bacterium]